MSRMIGAREISEYAQKYNMPLGKDTPLSMEWCFDMADKAYHLGRADAINEMKDKLQLSAIYTETENGWSGMTVDTIQIDEIAEELKEK